MASDPVCQLMNVKRAIQDGLPDINVNRRLLKWHPNSIQLAQEDPFYDPLPIKVTVETRTPLLVKQPPGRRIMIQHDVTSPETLLEHPSGQRNKGSSEENGPSPARIALGHSWLNLRNMRPWRHSTPLR